VTSIDHRGLRDAGLALRVVCGRDAMDSTSIPESVPDYFALLDRGVEGLRIRRITDFARGC